MVIEKQIKQGFTLAEIVVALSVIGVLAAMLYPTIINIMPDRNQLIFKDVFYDTKRIVEELINDETFYPEYYSPEDDPLAPEGQVYDEDSQGFGNGNVAFINGNPFAGVDKFCALFSSKLLVRGIVSYQANPFVDGVASTGNFTTADNVIWSMDLNLFQNPVTLSVDTNGTDRPNCYFHNQNCKNPDRFRIIINRNGTVELPDFERSIINRNVPLVTDNN